MSVARVFESTVSGGGILGHRFMQEVSMRMGWNGTGIVQKASIATITQDMGKARGDGYASYWLAEHPTGGFDALTALAVAGQGVPDLEIGTAVVPTFPRHPLVLAGQALTATQALEGRFSLGVGLSHAHMMSALGIDFEKPIRHLREYLSILVPLLETGEVDFKGEALSCTATLFQPGAHRCSVLVAALGPQALRVAGQWAAGTTLAWVGPKTVKEHIAPTIREAAASHDRPDPRIMATLPVCVTDEPAAVRERLGSVLGDYNKMPSYRAMFEREGASGPGDVAIVGTAAEVQDRIAGLADAGVTDFCPNIFAVNRADGEATQAELEAAIRLYNSKT